jgi:3-oxoacyl-[acyl-carrier protein] reductase
MSKLQGKVAIVTGASKGIGAAIARQLGAAGASVVVNYSSSKEGAERVVDQIKTAGGQAIAVGANMSKKGEIDRLFAATKEAFGRLDILVNNAGIYQMAPLEAITEASFHDQFNLNVLGLILATQKAVGAFGPEGGSIINISSVVGVSPMPGASVYSATKAAVDAVTKSLARELGPKKIRVNSTPAWSRPRASTPPASWGPTSRNSSSPRPRSAGSASPTTSPPSPSSSPPTTPGGSPARPCSPPAARIRSEPPAESVLIRPGGRDNIPVRRPYRPNPIGPSRPGPGDRP